MPTPMQSMHARWKRDREAAEAGKAPATRRTRRTTPATPATADPGAATEPDPTREEDDS